MLVDVLVFGAVVCYWWLSGTRVLSLLVVYGLSFLIVTVVYWFIGYWLYCSCLYRFVGYRPVVAVWDSGLVFVGCFVVSCLIGWWLLFIGCLLIGFELYFMVLVVNV